MFDKFEKMKLNLSNIEENASAWSKRKIKERSGKGKRQRWVRLAHLLGLLSKVTKFFLQTRIKLRYTSSVVCIIHKR